MNNAMKRRKLSREILGLAGQSALISLLLFLVLSRIAAGVAETYCFEKDIAMTEFDWIAVDRWIFSVSALLSCVSFSVLFLFLLKDRIQYIRKITAGIAALHMPDTAVSIPVEGNNELTELACAINDMSETRRQLREKEQTLANEKEQLIRTLSHDIRTPLTSILAYSDYLTAKETVTPEERTAYLELIRRKAEQIRELTDVLLDGSRRSPERFDDGRLLMEQLAEEFQEELEDEFAVGADLSGCPAFSGTFDVQELRRIFDNLSSNVRKYADPARPVLLSIRLDNGSLLISQSNSTLPRTAPAEGYQIGLNSIRRIAQHYDGTVSVEESGGAFSICIKLANL